MLQKIVALIICGFININIVMIIKCIKNKLPGPFLFNSFALLLNLVILVGITI